MSEMLHIDWTACDGRGLCTELLEQLQRDEWGYPLTTDGGGSDVPIGHPGLLKVLVTLLVRPRMRLVWS